MQTNSNIISQHIRLPTTLHRQLLTSELEDNVWGAFMRTGGRKAAPSEVGPIHFEDVLWAMRDHILQHHELIVPMHYEGRWIIRYQVENCDLIQYFPDRADLREAADYIEAELAKRALKVKYPR